MERLILAGLTVMLLYITATPSPFSSIARASTLDSNGVVRWLNRV